MVWVLSPAFEIIQTIPYIPIVHMQFHPTDPLLILASAQLGFGRLDALFASQDDGLSFLPISLNGLPVGVLAVNGAPLSTFAIGGAASAGSPSYIDQDDIDDRLNIVLVTAPGASQAFQFSTPSQLLASLNATAPPSKSGPGFFPWTRGRRGRTAVAAALSDVTIAATDAPLSDKTTAGGRLRAARRALIATLGGDAAAEVALAKAEDDVASAFDSFTGESASESGTRAAVRRALAAMDGGARDATIDVADIGGEGDGADARIRQVFAELSEAAGTKPLVGNAATRSGARAAAASAATSRGRESPIVILSSLSAFMQASSALGGPLARAMRITLPPTPWPSANPVAAKVADDTMGNRVAYIAAVGRYLFIAMYYSETRRFELRLSKDNGRTMRRLIMPQNQVETSYRVLGSDDGMLYLHIDHVDRNPLIGCDEQPRPFGTVYRADAESQRLTIVLPGVRRVCSHVDWYTVRGIAGAAIANVLSRPTLACLYCGSVSECKIACNFISVITWDHGQSWFPLSRTAARHRVAIRGGGVTANTTGMLPEDQLHVQSTIDNPDTVLPLMARGAAPGALTLLANRGPILDSVGGEVELFHSRDAGHTWRVLGRGHRSGLVLDQGGLIFHSRRGGAVTDVSVSFDAGQTYEVLDLPTPRPMEVVTPVPGRSGILSRYVIAFSTSVNSSTAITKMDFSEARDLPACSTAGLPDASAESALQVAYARSAAVAAGVSSSAGYEAWQETGDAQCNLGRQRVLIRRARGVACWGVPITKMTRYGARCPCHPVADFDCSAGYARALDGSCVEDEGALGGDADGLCDPATNTMISTRGYVRFPGDECEGGNYDPDIQPCGWVSGKTKLVIALLALLAAIGALFVGYHIYLVNPVARGYVDTFLERYAPSLAQYMASNAVLSVPQFHSRLDNPMVSFNSDDDDDDFDAGIGAFNREPTANAVVSSTTSPTGLPVPKQSLDGRYRASAALDSDSDLDNGAAQPATTAPPPRAVQDAVPGAPRAAPAGAAAAPPSAAALAAARARAARQQPPEDDEELFGP